MANNDFDFYSPFFFDFSHRKLEKFYIYRKHKFVLSVWRNHVEVERKVFNHARLLRSYLDSSGWNSSYDFGDCMIYIYLDDIEIFYPDFLKGVYSYA